MSHTEQLFFHLFGYAITRFVICNSSFDFSEISQDLLTCFYSPALSQFSSPHLMVLGNSNLILSLFVVEEFNSVEPQVLNSSKNYTYAHYKSFEGVSPVPLEKSYKSSHTLRVRLLSEQESFTLIHIKCLHFFLIWAFHTDILKL